MVQDTGSNLKHLYGHSVYSGTVEDVQQQQSDLYQLPSTSSEERVEARFETAFAPSSDFMSLVQQYLDVLDPVRRSESFVCTADDDELGMNHVVTDEGISRDKSCSRNLNAT